MHPTCPVETRGLPSELPRLLSRCLQPHGDNIYVNSTHVKIAIHGIARRRTLDLNPFVFIMLQLIMSQISPLRTCRSTSRKRLRTSRITLE